MHLLALSAQYATEGLCNGGWAAVKTLRLHVLLALDQEVILLI